MTFILLVDDEEDIRNLGKMILENAGYHVLTSRNSGEALTIAEENRPDLILMDVVMPGRDGFDTCKVLKFKASTKNIPIVVFSAISRDVDKSMAKEAGADGYISKPFKPEKLLFEIKKHIQPNKGIVKLIN